MKKPLILVLAVSLCFNIFFLIKGIPTPESDKGDLLASVGNEEFRFLDLKDETRDQVARIRRNAEAVIYREAENWIQDLILPKEASARSVSEKELLAAEVGSKVKVTPQEIYRRYVLSPDGDRSPWPDVLKKIGVVLRKERSAEVKTFYLRSLFQKYNVKLSLPWTRSKPQKFVPYQALKASEGVAGSVAGPPSRGSANAPVVMEVYSDFLCPYSHRFATTPDILLKEYPDKVRVVYRQFPLPMHSGAHLMAEASVCAQEQGKFWEYHDRLMSRETTAMEKSALSALALELGLDASRFDLCLDSARTAAFVDREIADGKKVGVEGTPAFTLNGRLSFGVVPIETLKTYVNWFLAPKDVYPGRTPAKKGARGGAAVDPDRVQSFPADWLTSGSSIGPKNAPVTLVEFYDYNCPYCQKGGLTVNQLIKNHPDLRVLPKHYPLPMHPNAMKTSQAAACAEDQGKYWEYRNEIFGGSWGKSNSSDLKAIATKIGLKEKEFNTCLDEDKTKERVQKDMAIAGSSGVGSTPSYFINGRPLMGAQPLEAFEKAVIAAKNLPKEKE